MINRFEKSQEANLYLKNLDDSVDYEKLKEILCEYRNVTSSKVIIKKAYIHSQIYVVDVTLSLIQAFN